MSDAKPIPREVLTGVRIPLYVRNEGCNVEPHPEGGCDLTAFTLALMDLAENLTSPSVDYQCAWGACGLKEEDMGGKPWELSDEDAAKLHASECPVRVARRLTGKP